MKRLLHYLSLSIFRPKINQSKSQKFVNNKIRWLAHSCVFQTQCMDPFTTAFHCRCCHVGQISSMRALLEEFLLLKRYDVLPVERNLGNQRTNKPVSHYQDTWSHRRSHQGNNENLPKHQRHILPTVDGKKCLDSQKLRKAPS